MKAAVAKVSAAAHQGLALLWWWTLYTFRAPRGMRTGCGVPQYVGTCTVQEHQPTASADEPSVPAGVRSIGCHNCCLKP